MSKARSVLVHLALGLAGWGIATALSPFLASAENHSAPKSTALPTKTDRARLDVPAGQRLLARILPGREIDPSSTNPQPPPPSLESQIEEIMREFASVHDLSRTSPEDLADIKAQATETAMRKELHSRVNGSNGPDFAHAFRHGRMEAMEIRDQLADLLPEHAKIRGFNTCIYLELVAWDPSRAEPLLDGLPPAQVAAAKFSLLDDPSERINSDQFSALLQTFPSGDETVSGHERQRFWNHATEFYVKEYGTSFTAWVEMLSPGTDRDMALVAIAKQYGSANPAEAARLRALSRVLHGIDDP